MLSVHCHDDLGLAVANSLTAVERGASQVEVAVNGLGERGATPLWRKWLWHSSRAVTS